MTKILCRNFEKNFFKIMPKMAARKTFLHAGFFMLIS